MRRSLALATAALAVGPPGATPATPVFHGSSRPVPAAVRERMTSWRPGCPMPVSALRLVTVSHWGLDGAVHTGQIVVHRDAVSPVLHALRSLFEARFPIRRMRLVEAYGADDDRSMAADNTSGFNCRRIEGSSAWSEHAYGRAIDVNPLENPYVVGTHVSPPGGRRFADRTLRVQGMIHPGDAVVRAFASVGWKWGGDWRSPKDYQHFSATGR